MGISIVFARGIVSELQSRGFNPQEFLEGIGFDNTRLSELRESLSLEELDVMACKAMELTGDPGLGLTIGARAPESMLQIFGHLLVAQRTLRESIATLRRYSGLISESANWGLYERGDVAQLTCDPTVQLGDATRCALDYGIAISARIGHHFTPQGGGPTLREVHFQHQKPSYAARYTEVFRCPVEFGRESNALFFPRRLLDLPQFHADHTVRTVLRETADRLLQERARAQSVAERVRTLLRYEPALAKVDVERIARQLGLSARALRRRLGTEGTPLSALVDEARCRIACEELRRPDTTIKETAELLGFSEPSAFHRAFKRWTGQTPAAYSRVTEKAPAEDDALATHSGRPAERTQPESRSG